MTKPSPHTPAAGRATPPQPGAASAPPTPAQPAPPKPGSGGTARIIPQITSSNLKKTILVCDDVAQIRKILCFNLRSANYETIEAEDGAEAIKIAQTRKVDLILMDIMTPRVDGFTACGKIKSNPTTKGIPIIMLTACSQKEDVIRALSNGACDYIVKPFKKETVLQKIEKALFGTTPTADPDPLSTPPPSTPSVPPLAPSP